MNQSRLPDPLAEATRRRFLVRMLQAGGVAGLAGPAATLLAACGGDPEDPGPRATPASSVQVPDNDWKIVVQFYTLNNAYFQGWSKASDESAAALKLKYERQVDEINNEKLLTIFENAASSGVNGITSEIADPGISDKVLKIASDAEIYTSMAWNLAPWLSPLDVGKYFYSFTTPNNITGTQATVEQLFEKMGGEGEFIHITGIPGNTVDIYRTVGVDNALKKYPKIKMVAREPGQFSRGETTGVIEALLTAHSGVKGIFCQNDDMAVAVVAALRSRDMVVPVAGVDAIPDFVEAMIGDPDRAFATWTTSSGGGPWLGAWLMVQIFDALSGVELRAPERMMYCGGFILNTAKAAEAYNKLMFSDSGSFPFDYTLWSKALHPEDWDPQALLAPIDYPAHFAVQEAQPAGYEVASEFTKAKTDGEFDKVQAEYAEHFKSDPFAEVRKLCTGGGEDIV